jgi:diguanylate cyclase (GGDEF)-like protein
MTFREALMAVDLSTLYVVAALVAGTLGLMLLLFGRQERIAALRWWGSAYILGASAIGMWAVGGSALPPAAVLLLNTTGFIACGLVWTAARVFHGCKPHAALAMVGACLWLILGVGLSGYWPASRAIVGAAVVAGYAGLTAFELWRERRRMLHGSWPAIVVPILHGAVLMMPILIGEYLESDLGLIGARNIWAVLFAMELVLYSVGTVCIIFMLAAERAVSFHKTVALHDPLTGLLNRLGFCKAAVRLGETEAAAGRQVTVMVFDLDHFKAVNDRFGHAKGDEVLQVFAGVAGSSLRVSDIVGRIGGEEFAAYLPCALTEATIAAERVRRAFANIGVKAGGTELETSVSIGMAGGPATVPLHALLAAADKALYRAKGLGRNRYEMATEADFEPEDLQPRAALTREAAAGERRLKLASRMPQLLPTLDPETSHLPLKL